MRIILIAHIFYWLYLLFNFILFIISYIVPNYMNINYFIIVGSINFILLSIITIITIKNQICNIRTFKNKHSSFGMFIYYLIFNMVYIILNSLLLYKNIVIRPKLIMFLVCNIIYGGLNYMFLIANSENNTDDTSIVHPYIEISDIPLIIEQ